MTRATRAARGAAGAAIATLLAAASHLLAGGASSWLAVVATTILALPVCTLLAGRIGSLWRLGLAVAAAQVPFHWALSSLGAAGPASTSSASEGAAAVAPHAAHLAAVQTFAPSASASALDAGMWLGHAIAAAVTIALLHAGERAFLGLIRLVRRALPLAHPLVSPAQRSAAAPPIAAALPVLVDRLLGQAAITHRGPPAFPA